MQVGTYTVWKPNYTSIVSYRYEYDGVGNITKIKDSKNGDRTLAAYTYDALGQLTQEILYSYDTNGNATATTYAYTYDTAGNILSETETVNNTVVSEKEYTYGNSAWRDLLTEVNGLSNVYDDVGNPTTYKTGIVDRAGNPEVYYMDWIEGRRLASLRYDDGQGYFDVEYQYDADGIRTYKDVDGEIHTYITQNGKVVRETIGSGTTAKVLDFIYDEGGRPFALVYTNGTATPVTYYYVLNLQGDVVALMTASRTIVAEYTYNAWGKVLPATGTMANINPIRYRGYYYDSETGFYYLQSRYYDPEIGRMINLDSQLNISLGFIGFNLFAYCLNNPVNKIDSNGKAPVDLFDTMDEAAIDFANYINAESIEVDREYASFIYAVTVWEVTEITYINPNIYGSNLLWKFWNYLFGGSVTKTTTKLVKVTKYTYVEPNEGSAHGVIIPINWFGLKNKVAEIHTHGAYSPGYTNDDFSKTDLNDWVNYLVTPLGTVRRYDPSDGSNIIIYNEAPFDPNHPEK